MNQNGLIIGVIILCLKFSMAYGQGKPVALPYKVIAGKMIVEVLVQGKKTVFIFDTGAHTVISSSLRDRLGIVSSAKQTLTDANSKQAIVEQVLLSNISTLDSGFSFDNLNALVIDNPMFSCFEEAEGLLGSNFFVNSCITIDDREKMIFIHDQSQLSSNGNVPVFEFIPSAKKMPIFKLALGNYLETDVLFDTGAKELLIPSRKDLQQLINTGDATLMQEGFVEGAISGLGKVEPSKSYQARLNKLRIAKLNFHDLRLQPANVPYALMGYSLLNYGRVTIDYPKELICFEAYEAKAKIYHQAAKWEIDFKEVGGNLLIAGLWGDWGNVLALNDRILRIDGQSLGVLNSCEVIINGLPQLKDKNQITIEVQTAGGIKELTVLKK